MSTSVPTFVDDLNDTPFLRVVLGFAGGVLAIVMSVALTFYVRRKDPGDKAMVAIAERISNGARSFLLTEYKWLCVFVALMSILIGASMPQDQTKLAGLYTVICFLTGAVLSGLAGYIGMSIATQANVRTAEACKESLNAGLSVAFKSGAVMGLNVVGFGVLGLSVLYLIFEDHESQDEDGNKTQLEWTYMSGFGFGASAIALFARVGGGVYTKAADVGADLVGKVEKDIPEDDPKNPAVIADNVGDNVGDVAGMGADLFESYVGSIIAAATLATTSSVVPTGTVGIIGATGKAALSSAYQNSAVALPFWLAGLGIVSSIVGVLAVRTSDAPQSADLTPEEKARSDVRLLESLLNSIRRAIMLAGLVVLGLSAIPCFTMFRDTNGFGGRIYGVVIIGLVSGVAIGYFTEYCTSYSYDPTISIARKSHTGPATVIIQGLGVGMLSAVVPTLVLAACILAANELAGVYGISIAAVSMLSTLGVTLATDAYGPVADNAGGIAEMCHADPEVRERTDALDALGNTTAATGKGFAIGSAVLTAIGLINAYMTSTGVRDINLSQPVVLTGVLLGAMLPYLFAALTMLSVGASAERIILEVRDQFYTTPQILAGTVEPDYDRCVRIATEAAIQEMFIPGMIAVFAPPVFGFLLGAAALAGMLGGALVSGFMLAVTMANAGGAWDNAKKYVEKGLLGPGKGKRSEFHKATVVGDTVGDPFKDTSGPALNILIKLMSVISLVLAPLFKKYALTPFTSEGTITSVIIFVVVMVLCVIAQRRFTAQAAAFSRAVEAKRDALGDKTLAEVAAASGAPGAEAAAAKDEEGDVEVHDNAAAKPDAVEVQVDAEVGAEAAAPKDADVDAEAAEH